MSHPADHGLKFGAISTGTPGDYDALAAQVYALAHQGYTHPPPEPATRPAWPVQPSRQGGR